MRSQMVGANLFNDQPTLLRPTVAVHTQTRRRLRHLNVAVSYININSSPSFRFRLRRSRVVTEQSMFGRSFQDPRNLLSTSRGRGDDDAGGEESKVRGASLATSWSSMDVKWRFLSGVVTSLVLICGVVMHQWLGGACARGKEWMKPRLESLERWSEPWRFWAYIFCLVFAWLSIAFFLQLQVQRWELRTMVVQGFTDGAFDPWGSVCRSNTGLGCQISFTAM